MIEIARGTGFQPVIWEAAAAAPLNICWRESSNLELKDPVALDDMAGARRGEVRSENQHRPVSVTLRELAPRLASLLPVTIESTFPVGMAKLNRMMHQIAADYGLFAARGNPDADVARSVAVGRFQPDLVG